MFTCPDFILSMIRETMRLSGPKRILLAELSNPSLAVELIKNLNSQDELLIIDVDSEVLQKTENALNAETAYQNNKSCVSFASRLVWEIDKPEYFDSIILGRALTYQNDKCIVETIEACRKLLKPSGTLSCFEVFGTIESQQIFKSTKDKTVHGALEFYLNHFSMYDETTFADGLPVTVNHLKFNPYTAEDALSVHAVDGRYTLSLGPVRIAKDILKFALPLGGASLGMKLHGSRFWYTPLVMLAGVAAFLRDPEREIKADPNIILSACDGEVLDVAEVTDPNLGEGKWLRIATFLSIFNTHINRAPVSGKIIAQFDAVGGYANAKLPKANHNYSTYVVLDTQHGNIAVAQRVGLIARRIYNWVKCGEILAQGDRYGLIRMGSRTDVYLPCGKFRPLVKVGDKIEAGITAIAVLNDAVKDEAPAEKAFAAEQAETAESVKSEPEITEPAAEKTEE